TLRILPGGLRRGRHDGRRRRHEAEASHLSPVRPRLRARLHGKAMTRAAALVLAGASAAACAAAPEGPFQAPARIALGDGRSPQALAAGDFDGDGRLDLLVASGGTGDVTILLGDGRGGFRAGRSFPAGPEPTEMFVGDFDRDGHADVAIANHGTP